MDLATAEIDIRQDLECDASACAQSIIMLGFDISC